jgi:hypothetical protein
MSFGFNPETAIAVFLGVIAWGQFRKNGSSPCCQDSCCSEAPASAPAVVVAAPVAVAAPAPVATPAPVVVAATPAVSAPVAAPAVVEGEDPTLLAVLAAAVAVTLGPNARIVGVSPVLHQGQSISALTAWSMEGRREIYLSHRIR